MRLQLAFDDIPTAEIRETLKKKAFKWSPKNKVWQRVLNANAEYSVTLMFKNGILKGLKKKVVEESSLNAPQIPFFENLKEAKKYFLAWALKNLRGKKVYHKELEKWVHFNRMGIENFIRKNVIDFTSRKYV